MISKKEIQHIAQLARIKITKKEEEKFIKEISLILDYFKQLKKVKTKNIPACIGYTKDIAGRQPIACLISKTKIYKNLRKQLLNKSQKLLQMAPETQNDYLKIKSVF